MDDAPVVQHEDETHRKVELLLRLADDLVRDKKLEEARGAIEQALALEPASERVLLQLANAHSRLGDRRGAMKLLRRGLARKKLQMRAHFLASLAQEMSAAGRHKDALVHMRRAVALDPTEAPFHASLGALLMELGRFKDAVAPLERAVSLSPQDLVVRRTLAGAMLRAGRAADAIPVYVELLKRDPKQYLARAELAEAYSQIGKYIRASKQARLASKHCPDDFESHFLLGTMFGMSGAGEFAILHLQRAVELDPVSGQAWSNLSAALLDCGEEKKALRAAKRALEADPEDPRAWINFGEACGFLERYEEAIGAFAQAAALDTHHETNARERLQYARTMLRKFGSLAGSDSPE